MADRPSRSYQTRDDKPPRRVPGWIKVLAGVLLLAALIVLVMILVVGGGHGGGPARHF